MSAQIQQIFPFHIRTNKTKRQSEADYTKVNPLRIPMFANGLELTMGAEFQQKAIVLIFIDGTRRFDSTDEGNSLKGHLKYVIPLGVVLPRDSKVEVYVYNGIDDNFVECSFNLFLDETLKLIPSESVPLDRDVFNRLVSASQELFPFRVYNNETVTQLIDMEGYKKLLVTISASTIPTITEEQAPDQGSQGTVVDVLYDFTQTSSTTTLAVSGHEETDSYDVDQIIDFGSIRNRSLTVDKNKQTQTIIDTENWHLAGIDPLSDGDIRREEILMDKTETYDISESDDPTFTTGITIIETGISDIPNPLVTTKRYLKIVEHVSVSFSDRSISLGNQNNSGGFLFDITRDVNYNKVPTLLTNWLDTLSQGGQVDLSWEILGSGNQWFELISSVEFGTITQGSQVITQVGDAVSRINTDKIGFVLPSTQTSFRSKLVATNGIETGISIIKVA